MIIEATAMIVGGIALVLLGFLAMIAKFYKKVPQGKAIVRTGMGGLKVSFQGIFVIPVIHKCEIMDISLKNIDISREGKQGLICKDNMRADIRVAFFVRVNNDQKDVAAVAQTIGCERASEIDQLRTLFEAKFSEALKTAGKRFDFVDLYSARVEFKQEVIDIIGTDLNGYVLDDCAIDYLEQTDVEELDPDNILDAEGIKKITELTATQKVQANLVKNDETKRIKKQDVEGREAVLALERQQIEAEEKQKREIAEVRAREEASAEKIRQEERLKSEQAKIQVEEELGIAEENKRRQVLVAEKSKERTEALENERIHKERSLAENERERVVEIARIEKERAVEEERKNIQDVIRERVSVQKAVVMEEEKIKDTQAFAEAERKKAVAIKEAEQKAEEALVMELKSAEAAKEAAKMQAEKQRTEAAAEFETASQKAEALKIMAEAKSAEIAAQGMAEAQVTEARALAREKEAFAEARAIEAASEAEAKGIAAKSEAQAEGNKLLGEAEADVLKKKMIAEAEGMEVKANAIEMEGKAEAAVLKEKAMVEAQRIEAEAEAMKHLDDETRALEQFKLKLNMEKEVALARLEVQREMAKAQASVLAEVMKSANIDIVGGEAAFIDRIMNSITMGKSVDHFLNNSETLTEVKDNLLSGENGNLIEKVKGFVQQFGLTTEDIKNLSIASLLHKLQGMAETAQQKQTLESAHEKAKAMGLSEMLISNWIR
ncbi:flotillin family protein [Limibacter armeniacum]|uniref:flotillin family protein n=1 Tax=Limibacter armeniacum TaxID=466084 RepID=UPI002FE6AED2